MENTNHKFIQDFEKKLCEYTGFKTAILTDSCTNAIFLSLLISKKENEIFIPKYTYISVPMVLERLKLDWSFSNKMWNSYYYITEQVVDSAVWLERDMSQQFKDGELVCVSFGEKKGLSTGKGGAILTNITNKKIINKLRRLSFDGRDYTKSLKKDKITILGYHMNMSPSQAMLGLHQLNLKCDNKCLINNNWASYLDISEFPIFKNK